MAESVEGYSQQPWVFQLMGYAFSLLGIIVSVMVKGLLKCGKHSVSIGSWQGFKHRCKFLADVEYSRVAFLFRSDPYSFSGLNKEAPSVNIRMHEPSIPAH